MYADAFAPVDLLCERAAMIAQVSEALTSVTDPKAKAMLLETMTILLASIKPPADNVVPLRTVADATLKK